MMLYSCFYFSRRIPQVSNHIWGGLCIKKFESLFPDKLDKVIFFNI